MSVSDCKFQQIVPWHVEFLPFAVVRSVVLMHFLTLLVSKYSQFHQDFHLTLAFEDDVLFVGDSKQQSDVSIS
jgi:hypothetical protein